MLEPTATPMLRVSLFFSETVTAVACSAALPTIGMRINPTHCFLILPEAETASTLSTNHSEVIVTS